MKWFRTSKWWVKMVFTLLALLIVLVSTGVWFVRRPWPQIDGAITVPGLQSPVEVRRDERGVVHIYAENEHDLFFAQGYTHAQDRLWQMEFNRRLGSGTLSEILGQPAIDSDLNARYFLLRQVAEQSWTEVDSDTRVILEAYAAGINAYVDAHRNSLPLEFTILGVTPEPWTPVDILTWGPLMGSFTQAFHHDYELFRSKAVAEMGEGAVEQLLPPYAKNSPFIFPPEAQGYKWMRGVPLDGLASIKELLGDMTFWGSGAWVIDGNHTKTGKPLLANDPHLPMWLPSVWYKNGLHGGRFDVVGFSFPGVPLVVTGHNQYIAWGSANMNPDTRDFYIEKLNDPKNPTQYEFMGKWYDLEVKQETLKVKNGEPVTLEISLTRHGPIMNKLFKLPDTAEPLALRWSGYDSRSIVRSIMLMNLAKNWDEFRAALRYWDGIGMSFLYADGEGNIGLQTTGLVPIRVPKDLGIVPMPGWTGEYEWQGYIPSEELPSMLNPTSGFIATANNRIISPDDYPYLLSYDWFSPGYRAKRINQLIEEQLAADHLFTVEDMRTIQADVYSYPAEVLRPYLLTVTPENDLQAKALEYVKAWDRHLTVDSQGAAIYEVWVSFLIDDTFEDELKKHNLTGMYGFSWMKKMVALVELMQDANNIWFDDVNTDAVETRDDIIQRSFLDALAWLNEHYGNDPGEWKWGKIHLARFNHMPLGNAGPILGAILNSKTYPFPGDSFSVNLSYGERGKDAFYVWAAASQRTILDLNDWDSMQGSISTGQSGQLFHPNRDDQVQLWSDTQYHLIPFSREAVEAKAKNVLLLTPQK